MCNNAHFLKTMYKDNSIVQVANGDYVEGTGAGVVKLKVEGNDGINDVLVNNALLTESIEKNILSVSKLTQAGAEIVFTKDEAYVCKGGELVMKAIAKNGLYVLTTDVMSYKKRKLN